MVLILHSNPCVQRLRLRLTRTYPTSDVNSWISSAITHSVEQLDLDFYSSKYDVKLLPTVFNCSTLVSLKLASKIDLNVPVVVTLLNLKIVFLHKIYSLCNTDINTILSGSPILEELVIHRDYYDDIKIFSIVSSSLKTLVIKDSRDNDDCYLVVIDAPKHEYLVVIDAPKHEYLELYDPRFEVKLDRVRN
ncbi:F-box/RNI-like/FBD-like domains-containing protein [Euphorbia peplus]|nr:F-box/RNI-like/FBD-like domains-containing protein [Euphorbia peplus]